MGRAKDSSNDLMAFTSDTGEVTAKNLSRASVVPIPHYIQKPLFVVWASACIGVILSSLRKGSEEDVQLFYLYYQAFIPMLAMLWLWGVNVRLFERQTVKYSLCFTNVTMQPLGRAVDDQKYCISSRQIYQVAGLLTSLVLTSAAAFTHLCVSGARSTAAYQPPLLYTALLALFILPGDFILKDVRTFFSQTVGRIVLPIREVTWADFLLADILTSLAKPLSDCERAICHLTMGPVMIPATTEQMCGSKSWVVPAGLCLPYIWRLIQCLRVWSDTGNRGQLFNALKYSTAFPVIILSAVKYQVPIEAWHSTYKPLWLAAAFLNSSYSYFWDIERDWEISFFTNSSGSHLRERMCGGLLRKPLLKSELCYGRAFYSYLIASNLFLRLAWTYKLSPHLRHNLFTVLIFTLLEVCRRFQWIFVRIEVELRKLQHLFGHDYGQLVPPVPPQKNNGGKAMDVADL